MPIQRVGQVFYQTTGHGFETEFFYNLPSGIQQWDLLTMILGVRMTAGAGSGDFHANSGTDWVNCLNYAGLVHRVVVLQYTVPGIVPSSVKVWSDYNSCVLSLVIVAHRYALSWNGNYVGTDINWPYPSYSPWYCGGIVPPNPPSPPVSLTVDRPGEVLAFFSPDWIGGTPTLSPGLTLEGWGNSATGPGGETIGGALGSRLYTAPGSTGQMWASYDARRYCAVAFPIYGTDAIPPQTDDRFTLDWRHGEQLNGATVRNRNFVAAAYHAARKKHVVCGGYDEEWFSTVFGDTWEVDLGAGTCLEVATPSFGARYGHTVCYDSYRERVMLWGAYSSDTSLWEYDTQWASRSQAGSPPSGRSAAKYGARLCYDPVARKGLLFGGGNYGTSGDSNETWEINFGANPVTWTKITPPTSPTGRRFHAMVYNPKDGLIYMTGGCYGSNPIPTLNDCWTYSMASHQWTQITGDLSLRGRTQHGMYYDSAHDWIVVVGGYTSQGVYGAGTVASQECQILVGNNWFPLSLSTSVAGPDGIHGEASFGFSYDSDRQSCLVSLGNWDGAYNPRNNIAEGYFVRPEIKYVGYYGRSLNEPPAFTIDLRAIPGQSGDWIYIWGWWQKNGYNIGPVTINDPNYELIFSWDSDPPANNAKVRVWRGMWGQVSITPSVVCPWGGYIRASYMASVYRNASANILASGSGWGSSTPGVGIRCTSGFDLPTGKNALTIGMFSTITAWGEGGYGSRVTTAPGFSRPGVVGSGYSGSVAVVDKYVVWGPNNHNTGPVVLIGDQGPMEGVGFAVLLEAAAPLPHISTITLAGNPLFVIAQDVVRFKFTSELAVDSPYRSVESYRIENLSGGGDACWIKEVLPVLGRTNSYLFISLGGIGFGNTYKFTVLDRAVHDNYGGMIEECSITWTHHRTKVDSAISGLASAYDLRQRSNLRGMIEAMMIEDEIIGGDF